MSSLRRLATVTILSSRLGHFGIFNSGVYTWKKDDKLGEYRFFYFQQQRKKIALIYHLKIENLQM